MSAYYRLGKIDRQTAEKLRSSKYQKDLFDDEGYGFHNEKGLTELTTIYGELEVEDLIPFSQPFFSDERQDLDGEGLPIILPVEGLDKLIKLMSLEVEEEFDTMFDKIKQFFECAKNGLKKEDFDLLSPVASYIHFRRLDWASVNDQMPYTHEGGNLVSASAWEYQLAEIVLIRKMFNFDKDYLVLYKW